jgi:hypothetical protein
VGSGLIVAAGLVLLLNRMFQAQDITGVVPTAGTFYSLQNSNFPPMPFNPFPTLPLYQLSDGSFAIDDREVIYPSISRFGVAGAGIDPPGSGSNEPPPPIPAAFNYGCGLWLDITRTSSNAVVLGLHNTRSDQTNIIWSSQDLNSTNWTSETNVIGAGGDFTQVLIDLGTRTNVFFRASEARDYVMITNFTGLGYSDTEVDPPDTMGAVGPNHFVQLLNSYKNDIAIVVRDKSSGNPVASTNAFQFFRIGTNYPTGDTLMDVRILYDHQSQRWVATALDGGNGGSKQVILAVSSSNNPANLVTGWSRYLLPVHGRSLFTDFPTLGLDANGLYVSVLQSDSNTNSGHTIMAIKKPEIYQGTLITRQLEITNDLPVWVIQPAVNFDFVPTNGYAWFVAKGPPDLTNYQGGAICYRRLQWFGTNASMDTNWFTVTSVTNYQDYYDLDGTNISLLPESGTDISAPQTNGSPIDLHETGSRLAMTVIRNGFLWTCQAVGLSGTNGAYAGDQTGTSVDRSGVQWLKLGVDAAGGSLSYSWHDRVYDRTKRFRQVTDNST